MLFHLWSFQVGFDLIVMDSVLSGYSSEDGTSAGRESSVSWNFRNSVLKISYDSFESCNIYFSWTICEVLNSKVSLNEFLSLSSYKPVSILKAEF